MQLLDYLKTLPDEASRARFALACGTSVGYLRGVAYGHKNPSDSLCIRIQAETSGAVKAVEVAPGRDFSFLERAVCSGGQR